MLTIKNVVLFFCLILFIFLPSKTFALSNNTQTPDNTNNNILDDTNGSNNTINNNELSDTNENNTGLQDQNTSNSDNNQQSIVYAPGNAEIKQVNILYNPNFYSYKIEIITNIPVSPLSLIVMSKLVSQQEIDLTNKDGKLKEISNWTDALSRQWGDKQSNSFVIDVSKEISRGEEKFIGRILLLGLYTEDGIKLTNPALLLFNGQYEKLPIPALQDVFTGGDYLAKTGVCTSGMSEKVNPVCDIIMSMPENFRLSFDSNFATNNPLLFVALIISILVLSIIIYVFLLISYFLTFILKRNPWGVIFDSKTLVPIEGAIVRIFDEERNKLLETKVTGKDGRFSFLPGSGKYYIRVTKPGYIFPSKILTYYHHPSYYHLYHGEEFIMKAANAMFVTNIPIDPQQQSSLTIKPPFIKKVLFDIARARWGLIISFIILLGLVSWIFFKILSFTPGENFFVTARYLLIFLIPIVILELYFWWNGGKVRILKKELTPAQKKDFASKIEVRQEKPVGSEKPKSKVWMIVLIVLVILLGAGFLIYSCRPSSNSGKNPTTQDTETSNNNEPTSTGNNNVNTDDGIQPTGPFQSLTSEQINCMKKNLSQQAYEEIVTTKRLPAADEEKALQSCNIPKP